MNESKSEVTQLCLTLCDPMDYSLPNSSTYGIFQARILEWVATGLLLRRQTLYCLSQQGSLPEMGSL